MSEQFQNVNVCSQDIEDVWLTPRELFRRTCIAEQTLANERHQRRGFPYAKRGKTVLYHWPTVHSILRASTINPNAVQ